MGERITNERLAGTLSSYAGLLISLGVRTQGELQGLCVAAPYGQLRYVCRETHGGHVHDIPGFIGSGTDKGFHNARDIYNAIHQSRAAISDTIGPWAEDTRRRASEGVTA